MTNRSCHSTSLEVTIPRVEVELLKLWLAVFAWLSVLLPTEGMAQGINYGFLAGLQTQVRQVVENIRPSVVGVSAQKRQWVQGGQIWFESVGSGIVVDDRGYVLTNAHVVKDGEKILVSLWTQGGKEYQATVVDTSPDFDLALLRVEGSTGSLISAPMGDSDALAQGDWLVCVGSPYGFDHSATLGMVSGLHRNLLIDGTPYRNMIQTDVTINQGNSGGPLLTLQGEVVGVAAAVFAPDKAYTSIGFAIPINQSRHFISSMLGAIIKSKRGPALQTFQTPQQSVQQQRSEFGQLFAPAQLMAVQTIQPQPAETNSEVIDWQPLPTPAPIYQLASPAAQVVPPIPEEKPPTVVPTRKEAINLNKHAPRDVTHAKFSDCTTCHTITTKLVANVNRPIPHPSVDKCNVCHILIREPVVQGPTTVAWKGLIDKIHGINTLGYSEWILLTTIFTIALLAATFKVDEGLLFVPALLFFGYEFKSAMTASLLFVTATGTLALWRLKRARCTNWRSLSTVATSVVLAAAGGAITSVCLPPGLLLPVLLASALLLAAVLTFQDLTLSAAWDGKTNRKGWVLHIEYNGKSHIFVLVPFLVVATAAAFVGGLLGNGGSWLLVPLCLAVLRIPLVVAVVVAGLTVPIVGLAGFLSHIVIEHAFPPLLISLCTAALIGALLGQLSTRIQHKIPVRIFASLLFGIAGVWILLHTTNAL